MQGWSFFMVVVSRRTRYKQQQILWPITLKLPVPVKTNVRDILNVVQRRNRKGTIWLLRPCEANCGIVNGQNTATLSVCYDMLKAVAAAEYWNSPLNSEFF